MTPLHYAAMGSSFKVVLILLTAGANLEARNKDGWTPLHGAAAASNDPAVVHALITFGARLQAKDEGGWTPLHAAAWNNTPAIVQMLIDAGAFVWIRDKYGNTPFDVIPDDSPLVGTDVYWRLKEGQ